MRLLRVISILVLTAFMAAGCMRDPLIYPNGEPGAITIRVFIPENAITKAEVGLVDPSGAERLITTLQIWVFRAGSTEATGLIGYRLLDGDALAATGLSIGHETRFTIPVTKAFMDEQPRPQVDVYAVVNGASAGLTIDKFAYTGPKLNLRTLCPTPFPVNALAWSRLHRQSRLRAFPWQALPQVRT